MKNWKDNLKERSVNRILNLGWMNGWLNDTHILHSKLEENRITHDVSRSISNNCYRVSFRSMIDGIVYNVSYSVDSSG